MIISACVGVVPLCTFAHVPVIVNVVAAALIESERLSNVTQLVAVAATTIESAAFHPVLAAVMSVVAPTVESNVSVVDAVIAKPYAVLMIDPRKGLLMTLSNRKGKRSNSPYVE